MERTVELIMDREEYMLTALGAHKENIAAALDLIASWSGMSFTEEEHRTLADMLDDPEYRLHLADMLTDGAERSGLFNDPV